MSQSPPPTPLYRDPRLDLVDSNRKTTAIVALIVAGVLTLMEPRLWTWLASQLFGTNFNPFLNPDGSTASYLSTSWFWSDLGITAFAVASAVEGAILLSTGKPLWLRVAAVVLLLAASINAGVVVYWYIAGFGLALLSLLAAIFGTWSGIRLLQEARTVPVEAQLVQA